MPHYPDEIEYSEKYMDERFEYRHVILTKPVAKEMYKLTQGKRLLDEGEWRGLGVTQSRGWAHYESTARSHTSCSFAARSGLTLSPAGWRRAGERAAAGMWHRAAPRGASTHRLRVGLSAERPMQ
eukprot:CAMPEP_0170222046 /NCGR_PEP_ID=MMETSP0116_2-20130129/10714_1 /TAXON_ID=400756 /ORGANISM="Durinskia baltica, Strain CSIRO CS-38" /LENGTH=124 /DNA_ID=CAMNT_0010472731 /DNA_START=92 /DNA_END=467 /DNA_ORIENTATION=+